MHVVILCGGSGSRLNDYSFPKPLNMINGKPSIAYCLEYLPATITTINFIAAPHLRQYNFEEIVINLFKDRQVKVHWLPYFTRGPIESAYLGLRNFPESDEPIVFLDNDVVYQFPDGFFTDSHSAAFLGYATDNTTTEAYSFLMVKDTKVVNIKEKKRISDNFCCGVYGFKSLNQFREVSEKILCGNFERELYMSMMFQRLLETGQQIDAVNFPMEVFHIGTIQELNSCWSRLKTPSMRICFDLDNTLVTYPSIPGDYTSVRPIQSTINMARKLHEEGHTIIIHTARRMATHKNNVGAVLRDIGALTFKTLEEFNIPYDEIIFGKPIADVYIDDRAINPYRSAPSLMGIQYVEPELPQNMLALNKYNKLEIKNNIVYKTGPTKFLRGEIYFYENMPSSPVLQAYFPKYIRSIQDTPNSTLMIEYIKGIPFYTLYKHKLITTKHIDQLLEFVDILHGTPGQLPSSADVKANYVDKLLDRFCLTEDYPFENAKELQERCISELRNYEPRLCAYIHGDLWFSNVIVDYNNKIMCIDMKGQVNNKLCMGGDELYDYGKIYQSLLGFDAALYGDVLEEEYAAKLREHFLQRIGACKGIEEKELRRVVIGLMMGTMHATEKESAKRIWSLICNVINSCGV